MDWIPAVGVAALNDRITKSEKARTTPAINPVIKAAAIEKGSRRALYLHFKNRTKQFIATTKYQDAVFCIDDMLAERRVPRSYEIRNPQASGHLGPASTQRKTCASRHS